MVTDGRVQGVDNNTGAKCKVCTIPRNKIELSNLGERAIKSHCIGKNHCKRIALYKETCRISFTPLRKQSSESPLTAICSICLNKLQKVRSFFVPELVSDAEVTLRREIFAWIYFHESFFLTFCLDLISRIGYR